MIKVVVHVTKVVITAVIAALFFSSCNGIGTEGNGNVTTQARNASGEFDAIEASGGLEVVIEQGAGNKITVEADDNLQSLIKTKVEGHKLKIYTDGIIRNAKAKRILVTLPAINAIEADGGTNVKGRTVIKTDKLELSADGGASLEVVAEAAHIGSDIGGGGHIKVSGKTDHLKASVSSGGNLEAKDLTAKSVDADASSGGTMLVNPTEKLKANASSGGNINYVTTPNSLSKDVSSGGNISQE